jgi:hypothetical protein
METRIKSFSDLHNEIQKHCGKSCIFRGHRDESWELKPKAGRFPNLNDEDVFEYWLGKCAGHFKEFHYSSRIEIMAIAQHHGLPTRLLDWTINPLAAAFFAVAESTGDTDAAIYVLSTNNILGSEYHTDPFNNKLSGTYLYVPPNIENRLIAQQGMFTLHTDPTTDIANQTNEYSNLVKIIIDKAYCSTLSRELDAYGINHMTLFPDMDGASKYVMWHLGVKNAK